MFLLRNSGRFRSWLSGSHYFGFGLSVRLDHCSHLRAWLLSGSSSNLGGRCGLHVQHCVDGVGIAERCSNTGRAASSDECSRTCQRSRPALAFCWPRPLLHDCDNQFVVDELEPFSPPGNAICKNSGTRLRDGFH